MSGGVGGGRVLCLGLDRCCCSCAPARSHSSWPARKSPAVPSRSRRHGAPEYRGPSYSRRALVFDFIFVNIYVKFPVVSVARMSGEETDRVQRRQLVSFSQTF